MRLPSLPQPQPSTRVSPSMAKVLEACLLRAAYDADASYKGFRQPHPNTLLGTTCHKLINVVGQGVYDGIDPDTATQLLADTWGKETEAGWEELKRRWESEHVPPPHRWPRYQTIRVALLRFLAGEVARRHSYGTATRRGEYEFKEELWLESPDGRLVGRPDRVEISASGVEIIDIKSGATREMAAGSIPLEHLNQLLFYCYLWHSNHHHWPSIASLQRPDGSRISIQVEPDQAEAVVERALLKLSEYNDHISSDSTQALARPSPDACIFCPYRIPCPSFWRSVGHDWGWYRKCALGTVVAARECGQSWLLDIAASRGNTAAMTGTVRLLDVPAHRARAVESKVMFVDAIPTQLPDHTRAAWDTQIWEWEESDEWPCYEVSGRFE